MAQIGVAGLGPDAVAPSPCGPDGTGAVCVGETVANPLAFSFNTEQAWDDSRLHFSVERLASSSHFLYDTKKFLIPAAGTNDGPGNLLCTPH